jgi:adenosylhomocysteine nucleosidase
MIWITFAVPFESAAFRRRAASRSVHIIHTGVGEDAARITLEEQFCNAKELPELLIASGFAGALIPDLHVGTLVTDSQPCMAGGGDPVLSGIRHVRFSHSEHVLATAEAKREFRDRTGAEVVDMETAAIREVCAAAEVPFRTLRAISDGAEDDLGLPPDLLGKLASQPLGSFPNLAWMLLTNPNRRKAFMRLIRDCRTAQTALADGLEREIANQSR